MPALEYAVKRCLEKDPANRWQSVRDLMNHLRWAVQTGVVPAIESASHGRKHLKLIAALAAVSAVLGLLVVYVALTGTRTTPAAAEMRFTLDVDIAGASAAVSPDGRWVVFAGRAPGSQTRSLFLRSIASTTPQKIADTDDALAPFWSPNSDRIGFFMGPSLKVVSVAGGAPETICAAPGSNRAGAWNHDDVIVFSSDNVLNRVQAGGGKPEPVTALNLQRAEIVHTAPVFLPDGKRFLFLSGSQQVADRAIAVGSLDSKDTTRLLAVQSMAVYSFGHLLYVENGNLVARPFDPDDLKFEGEPVRIAANVDPMFSVSDNGMLLYRQASTSVMRKSQFSWVDRTGKPLGTIGQAETYFPYWSLSPDAKRAAVTLMDQEAQNIDVAVLDLERGILSRVTTDPTPEADPRWSPDGLRVAYTSQKKGNRDILEKSASGIGEETALVSSSDPESIDDWSPDGKYILYRTGANTNTIFALPLFGDRKPFPVIESKFNKDSSHLSYDSKWLAYNAAESARSEVYIVSFPKPDQKRQISTNGGAQPRWRPDGKELYFVAGDGKMMAVDVTTEPTLSSGTPKLLFDTGLGRASFDGEDYGVTPDGKRFLLFKPLPDQEAEPPRLRPHTLVVNWAAALK
jgi:Tol biopolymer transport system component